jgi:hypothetical protein
MVAGSNAWFLIPELSGNVLTASEDKQMTLDLTKPPSKIFSQQLERISVIQTIQRDLQSVRASELEQKLSFLNQTYILHLVSLWQVFFEELVKYGFELIGKNREPGPYADLAAGATEKAIRYFRAPNTSNIDELIEETLLLQKISHCWHCAGLTREHACSTVAEVLSIRHDIAHVGETKKSLSYETNYAKMEVLYRIAQLTEDEVTRRLAEQ